MRVTFENPELELVAGGAQAFNFSVDYDPGDRDIYDYDVEVNDHFQREWVKVYGPPPPDTARDASGRCEVRFPPDARLPAGKHKFTLDVVNRHSREATAADFSAAAAG
jgi:hypothetical protein